MGYGALRFIQIAGSTPKTYPDWIQASSSLDVINDYTRFVITYFEVINTSAQHTYHSALPLSPRTSIIRDRYKQYARPLTKVVCRLPTSWEPATMCWSSRVHTVAWSPCNRFIAIVRFGALTGCSDSGFTQSLSTPWSLVCWSLIGWFLTRQPLCHAVHRGEKH